MSDAFPERVLIVDDEPHIRAFLRLIVKELGATEIAEAGDSPNALLMYQQLAPDLVLLDVNLPGDDGVAILERLIALDSDAQIVMLTAVASRTIVEKCAALGALNYLRKDLPRAELRKALQDLWAEMGAEQ